MVLWLRFANNSAKARNQDYGTDCLSATQMDMPERRSEILAKADGSTVNLESALILRQTVFYRLQVLINLLKNGIFFKLAKKNQDRQLLIISGTFFLVSAKSKTKTFV
jgi:hypothetical protein